MIGQIELSLNGQRKTAVLGDDLAWRSDDREVEELLNRLEPPPLSNHDRFHGPTATWPVAAARHVLYRVSHRLGAKVRT